MSALFAATLDSKFRLNFAQEATTSLSWHEEFVKSGAVHYLAPGADGQLRIIPGEIREKWSDQLANTLKTKANADILATLARGIGGMASIQVTTEAKRCRFTVPKALRGQGLCLTPGKEFAIIATGDLFELIPESDLPNANGPFLRIVSQAIDLLYKLQWEDWDKLTGEEIR